jgi:hypothetical protein
MFGCAGTAAQEGEGAAPFPQLRIVALTARAGRAVLGAILGQARAGEQTLRAQKARPKFRHTTATKHIVTGKPQVSIFAPAAVSTAARHPAS